MKKMIVALLATLVLAAGSTVAGATTIDLFEYKTIGGVENISAFDTVTGLGTLTLNVTGDGAHYAGLFVDHEIDQEINTYFNEKGLISGAVAAGLSWEIDEPTGTEGLAGDIKANFAAKTPDNMIFDGNDSLADDVSMALGWDFVLQAGETATISFLLSTIAPGSGFYLEQYDPDSDASIYFTSDLTIRNGGPPAVPEPSTILLLGAGLAGLGLYGRRRNKNR